MQFAKKDLYDFHPRVPCSFATPVVGLSVPELLEDDEDEATNHLVSGAVGEGLAVKFMAHLKLVHHYPIPTDILAGKVKELKTLRNRAFVFWTVHIML